MTTIILAKRYSLEDAQTIIAKFKKYSFDDLHKLFKQGKAPSFDEIEGDTLGSLLALNPKAVWWKKAAAGILFDSPLARWAGKRFVTPFDEEKKGKGINLFRNRIFPRRFRIDTYVTKAQLDQNPCLTVAYPHFPSSMFGIRDELRRIDEGVFLGQAHAKLIWGKQYSVQGYFLLCALNRPT